MRQLLTALMAVLPLATAHADPKGDAALRQQYMKVCLDNTAKTAEFRARAQVLAAAPVATPDNVRMISYMEQTAGKMASDAVRASSYEICVNTTRPLEEMRIIYENVNAEYDRASHELYDEQAPRVYGRSR